MKIPRQLRKLQVIDRLEVGPVRLEPNRLVAPYSVTQGGRQETTELVYRYEQEVFDPGDAGQQNMAAVMAAQVALNYGLFCKEIKLRGPLDRADRRFLIEAARNTAREIYVNKLLAPNPFLLAEARGLPARRLDDFLLARITFDGDPCVPPPPWSTEQTRHAVLSSGGKDSLLSYGLLGELGLEPHPIFINESGRHWYTAINAHRHLAREDPHLPLDMDAHDADLLCREVAAACTPPRPLVLPLVPYGVSYHHDDFPGTVSISPDTLSRLVHEVGMSLARQGISKLIIVNGHGGNDPALNFAAQTINRDAGIFTCVDTGETSDAEVEALCSTRNDVHAGEVETSTVSHPTVPAV